jgi:hypothetical protein
MPLSRRHAPFYLIILSVFQKIPYCILVLMLGEGSLARVSLALGRGWGGHLSQRSQSRMNWDQASRLTRGES